MKQEYENEPLIRNLGPGFLTRTDFLRPLFFHSLLFPTKEPSNILPLQSVEKRRNKKQHHILGMYYAKFFRSYSPETVESRYKEPLTI